MGDRGEEEGKVPGQQGARSLPLPAWTLTGPALASVSRAPPRGPRTAQAARPHGVSRQRISQV